MSNALSVLNKGNANLPAHLRQAMENDHSWDGVGGVAIPRIEVSDRRIKAILNGTEVASSKDPITVVLVKPGAVGRTFYAKEYQKGEKAKPDCYSIDGIKPAADAQNPQSNRCDTCEQNIKGSSKTMANAKACRYRQPVAVWIPSDKTWDTLFRVSLPATAIFPDEENADGFRPLNKYVKELRAAGANPNMVYTEMAIDDYQDQPRLLFKPIGWIENEEDFAQVRSLLESDAVDDILNTMPQDDDTATSGAGSALGQRPSHIDNDGVDTRRSRRADANQVPELPTEWPQGVGDTEFIDDNDTYWFHPESDSYFMVKAGENLPLDGVCEELSYEAFVSDVAQQKRELDEKRAAEEEARRKAEEEARRKAQEEAERAAALERAQSPTRRRAAPAADAGAGTTTRRRAAAPAPEADAAPAPTSRRRAPAPADDAPQDTAPAPTSRRRTAAPVTVTEQEGVTTVEEELAPAPTSRRRTAAAADTDTADAPRSRRRAPVPAGTGAAAPEDEGVAPPARRAAAAADPEAPASRQPSNNLAALEDIILAENNDD
ncbi:MAG: hypothetical protein [Bacteriophage sp.]|nr:MAG: hypothetical protein [Bacteriophage sp.]UVX54448.1 MAG: hypothetical protein [Bacteriophage sp.]